MKMHSQKYLKIHKSSTVSMWYFRAHLHSILIPWTFDEIHHFFSIWLTKYTIFSRQSLKIANFFHDHLTKFAIFFRDRFRNLQLFSFYFVIFWRNLRLISAVIRRSLYFFPETVTIFCSNNWPDFRILFMDCMIKFSAFVFWRT